MERKFEFNPWEQAEKKVQNGCLDIDVSEPPCKHCKFWRPRIETNRFGELDGIILCCKEDMLYDFSCFRLKVNNDEA